jgi:TolB-like protein/Tfp pilus assembly protein PilF
VSQEPPQVAVLAFRDRSGTEGGEIFARGFAEDVILQLGRNQGLGIVAPHSSFAVSGRNLGTAELGRRLAAQYLVDGFVQRNGDNLTVEVALIDARTEKILWVSRHTSEGGAVVNTRDEIVDRVAGTVLSKMRERERRRAVSVPPKTLDVYVLTQKAIALKHRFHPDAMRQARDVLKQALDIDPEYAPAWAVLGWLNSIDGHLNLTGDWSPLRADEVIAQVQHSLDLDSTDPRAYIALADAYSLAGREMEAAAASRRAVELAPSDAEAWLLHAFHLLPAHPPGEALAAINRALALYPIPPAYFDAMHSFVLWANAEGDAALRASTACTERAPRWRDCIVVQALVHAEAGEVDQARKVIKASGEVLGGLTSAAACRRYSGSATNVERCRSWARTAGIPS